MNRREFLRFLSAPVAVSAAALLSGIVPLDDPAFNWRCVYNPPDFMICGSEVQKLFEEFWGVSAEETASALAEEIWGTGSSTGPRNPNDLAALVRGG